MASKSCMNRNLGKCLAHSEAISLENESSELCSKSRNSILIQQQQRFCFKAKLHCITRNLKQGINDKRLTKKIKDLLFLLLVHVSQCQIRDLLRKQKDKLKAKARVII